MAPTGFTLESEIAVPPMMLRDFLSDLHNFSEFHPLIQSIEEQPRRPDRPNATFYRVVDIIPIGPFRMRTVYLAAIEVISGTEVVGDAWQRPGVRLHTVYELNPTGEGTRLVERVEIDAPWGLRGFVRAQAKAAHEETLRKIKDLLEDRLQAT